MSGNVVRRKLLVCVVAAAVICGLGFIVTAKTNAASVTGSDLTTSPVAVDLSVKPGQSISTTLQVQNNSPEPVNINVRLDKFKANGDSGQAAIYSPSKSDDSVNWVSFSRTSFLAEPGVWNSVVATINPPSNAANGYYYAVLFEPQTASSHGSSTNVIKGANAIFILLNANSGNEKRQLEVTGFTSQKSIYEYLPANFTVTVKNTGNIYVAPQGDVFISRKMNGKPLASLDINSAAGNVLPNSSRQFSVSWQDGFPVFVPKKINGQIVSSSNGQPVQQLQWNSSSSFSKIRFGKYYAHLAFVFNNGVTNETTDAYVSFWVIPWKMILILIVIIAAAVVIWRFFKKSIKAGYQKLKK